MSHKWFTIKIWCTRVLFWSAVDRNNWPTASAWCLACDTSQKHTYKHTFEWSECNEQHNWFIRINVIYCVDMQICSYMENEFAPFSSLCGWIWKLTNKKVLAHYLLYTSTPILSTIRTIDWHSAGPRFRLHFESGLNVEVSCNYCLH